MGGGNAQKTAMARAKNQAKAKADASGGGGSKGKEKRTNNMDIKCSVCMQCFPSTQVKAAQAHAESLKVLEKQIQSEGQKNFQKLLDDAKSEKKADMQKLVDEVNTKHKSDIKKLEKEITPLVQKEETKLGGAINSTQSYDVKQVIVKVLGQKDLKKVVSKVYNMGNGDLQKLVDVIQKNGNVQHGNVPSRESSLRG